MYVAQLTATHQTNRTRTIQFYRSDFFCIIFACDYVYDERKLQQQQKNRNYRSCIKITTISAIPFLYIISLRDSIIISSGGALLVWLLSQSDLNVKIKGNDKVARSATNVHTLQDRISLLFFDCPALVNLF